MINIAEILKDCPKGTKLYSPIFGEAKFEKVINNFIYCADNNECIINFDKYGKYKSNTNGEVMLFPSKENRDWSTFQRPFKDGDVIYIFTKSGFSFISIFKEMTENKIYSYVDLGVTLYFENFEGLCDLNRISISRFATEEEKQELFDAIKAKGYKWNAETKTLEKLVEPIFKVGNIVKSKTSQYKYTIADIRKDVYIMRFGTEKFDYYVPFSEEGNYELVSNKFDITTLKPFDKVLVRSYNSDIWECNLFSSYNKNCSNRFHCVGGWYDVCIPYEGNEYLLSTTNDCDEYYKTWE